MNCEKCGSNIRENDMFCPNCGTPVKRANNNEEKNENNIYTYERAENQQMNYNQKQQTQQNYGAQPNYSKPYQKNNNSGDTVKVVVGAIIVLAVIIAIVFIIYSVIIANDKNRNLNNNSQVVGGSSENNTGSSSSTGNKGTMTPVSNTASSYKVNYAGFKLNVPDTLIYEMDYSDDTMKIGDSSQTWVAQLSAQQVAFQKIKQNKSYLSSYVNQNLAAYNPNVSTATLENIGGVEFIIVEVNVAGENMLVGVAGLNSMYSMCFTLMNEDNDFNRDYLKDLATIISSAEYKGDSSYMKANENIKIKDIKDALQKVSEEQTNQ